MIADPHAADRAFRAVAEAAWQAFLQSPRAIAYRLRADESDMRLGRHQRTMEIVYDARSGAAGVDGKHSDEPIGAAPNLDAIGTFHFATHVDTAHLLFAAYQIVPYVPAAATPAPHVDASVAVSGAYVAHFDPRDKSATTIYLVPTAKYRATHEGWLLSRIRFDPVTMLPVDVDLSDPAGTLSLHYAPIGGYQLLEHVHFHAYVPVFLPSGDDSFPPQVIGSTYLTLDLSYDRYGFPLPGPDATPPAANRVE